MQPIMQICKAGVKRGICGLPMDPDQNFPDDSSVGNREIYRARKKAGLSMEKLAELSGVTQSQISRFESGKLEPRVRDIIALADAMHIDPLSLLPEVMRSSRQPAEQAPPSLDPLSWMIQEAFAAAGIPREEARFLSASIVEHGVRFGFRELAPEDERVARELARSLAAAALLRRRG